MDDLAIQQRQQALVDLMKKNGTLKSAPVERAFLAVPRHQFLPNEPVERAYADIAIAVRKKAEYEWTSSSSQPSMMAIMLEQLDLQPGYTVLEIGTGSGFNAALIAEIVGPEGHVVTVDIQPDLIAEARERLDSLGYQNIQAVAGDGGFGFPEGAPFDRIILTAGAEVIAPSWREQLVEGGRLVLPLSIGKTQKSVAFERRGNELASINTSDCGFMMLQGAFAGSETVKTPLGTNSDLYIDSSLPLPVDGAQIESWLSAPPVDLRSSIEVVESEAWSGLATWLVLQNIPYGILLAEGDQAQRSDIPALFYVGNGNEYRVKQSMTVVGSQGAAAITRPPEHPAPFFDWNSPVDEEARPPHPSFELVVRQLGPDPSPAENLLSVIRAWAEAGKPGSERISIRAIPAETDYHPGQGEFVIARPWTNLVISFK